MCLFAPVSDSIPCGLRVTAYPVPFKLPKGSKKMGQSGFPDRPGFGKEGY
jgi:hypothetical protein